MLDRVPERPSQARDSWRRLAELNALRDGQGLADVVQMAGALLLVLAATEIHRHGAAQRPRHAAVAVMWLEAPSGPTWSGPFETLPLRPWAVGGAILAYSARAVRDSALHAVALPLCGAVWLARRRDFAVGGGTPI